MRFLDLDLDFFLNYNAYYSGSDKDRLTSKYKPWSTSKVRHFLEERCGLSRDTPIQGRTVMTHNGVFDFLCTLIQCGRLRIPFDLIHIDAHPDMWVGDGLYLKSDFLHINTERLLAILSRKYIHAGNYLTFTIAYRWIASLLWICLHRYPGDLSKGDGDARSNLRQSWKRRGKDTDRDLPAAESSLAIPFKILFWQKFRTSEAFDYMAVSRSPDFTPPESDALIPVIEEYMKQI